jgi:hypothetical protein
LCDGDILITEYSRTSTVVITRGRRFRSLEVVVAEGLLYSLGEPAKTFQQSMGTRIHTIKSASLFAEIIAFDMGSQFDEEVITRPVFRAKTPASSNGLIVPGKFP